MCTWPPCLAAVVEACPTTGMCVQQRTNSTANTCYANGNKLTTLTMNGGRGMPILINGRVARADGSTCYSFDAQISGFGGGGTMIVYRNAMGAQLASGTLGQNGQLSITCPGSAPQALPVQCQPGLLGGGGPGGGGGGCTQGMCM
jgi:hypothetical protein